MSIFYQTKHTTKKIRWQMRRLAAASRWGIAALKAAPSILGNAMPKSGSHLIIQVLEGLIELGPFVNPGFPPINRFEDNSRLSETAMLARLQQMRSGDIAYGYIHAREPFLSALNQPGRANIFVFRDPRDVLVSHVFYATDMHTGHGMHKYYNETLETMEARLEAAILGVHEPDAAVAGVRQRYAPYLGWFDQPWCLCLRFEDLILDQENSLGTILKYLSGYGFTPNVPHHTAVAVLKNAIAPKKSGTFRKGKPGNWQEHFTDRNKVLFKEQAGDLLIALGYEKDHSW